MPTRRALAPMLIAALLVWPGQPWGEPPDMVAADQRASLVVIDKAARRLTLWRDAEIVGRYRIALGFAPTGDKRREGDGKTPEGRYRIDRKNANSAFHLSLGIDYPRPDQRAAAAAAGRDPGGDIFIHGQPNGWTGPAIPYDWTAGCAAGPNAEIREIWSLVAIGSPVVIRP